MAKKKKYDSRAFFEEHAEEIDRALLELVVQKKSPAASLTIMKVRGMIIDKAEKKVDVTISADELARARLRAARELRQERGGREVPDGFSPLPSQLRLHSGQGEDADPEVGQLAVSSGDSEDSAELQSADIPES